jgi:hypothetical protein
MGPSTRFARLATRRLVGLQIQQKLSVGPERIGAGLVPPVWDMTIVTSGIAG